MTWDPRDLGAPRRVANPPAPPEPPAPPPRSYELLLADWDDRLRDALQERLAVRECIPEPECEAEVPLYAEALQAEIQRSLYSSLLSKPKGAFTAAQLKDLVNGTVEQVCEPPKLNWPKDMLRGSFKAVIASLPEEGSAKLGNDAALRYVHPTYPELTPGMIDENHRALVERPMRAMEERVFSLQYGSSGGATGPVEGARGSDYLEPSHPYRMNGPTGPCGPAVDLADWLESTDYRGADAD